MDTRTRIDWLSIGAITPPLRHMAGTDVHISGEWEAEQFKDGYGETLGVWRVSGTMDTPDGDRPWSMVLKGWECGDPSGSPSAFNWPWREAHLYQSHVLEGLPGVSAPRCHGSVERDGAVWAWLDDLTVYPQPEWSVEHFAMAARHLGRFNGAYLTGSPNPDHPGISRGWLEGWAKASTTEMNALDTYLDHPRVREVLSPEVASAFTRIWERRETTLRELQSMPQGFAHLDAFPQNIFFRPDRGDDEMILIDWSFAGMAAPGEELAALCVASAGFNPPLMAIIDAAEDAAFNAYIDGLRDAGWRGDQAGVWRVYRTTALLRYGPGALSKWLPMITNEDIIAALAQTLGVSAEHYFTHLAALCRWIAERADDM